jgi:fucose 4-O-acetylase-like acetyltransferase
MPVPVPTSSTLLYATNRTSTSDRDESLDIAKGFGIILVVLGHCLLGLINSHFFQTPVSWPAVTVNTIYSFHMPLFFVISGYLASGKHRPAAATIRKLIPTVVYPYFLWSILQGLTQVYMTKYTTSHVPISVLYKIFWIPIVPYWFLYALFFCHLGYLAVRKLSHTLQLAISFCLYLLMLIALGHFGPNLPNIVMETTRAFVFFILGVATVSLIRRFDWKTALIATALFAICNIVVYRIQWADTSLAIVSLGIACAGIAATLAWSRLLARHRSVLSKTLAFLGRFSMSIYVIHIIITAGVRIAMQRAGANDSLIMTMAEIGLGMTLGITIPLAINWLASRLAIERWLGLQPMVTT